MVLRPAYPDIDSERQVVIEEIAMYEDEPSDKVHDVLAGGGLRRPPAGPADHRPRRGDLVGAGAADRGVARRAATCPANIVVAAAGNLDHDRIVELVDAAVRRRAAPVATAERGAGASGADDALPRQGDRAVPPLPWARRASRATTTAASRCAILDTILGGSTSSRLFQEVREKRGLAYSVYSYASPVRGHGPGRPLRRHAPRQRRRRRWR